MARQRDKRAWWQLYQDTRFPSYVTCNSPKIAGTMLKKGRQSLLQIEHDDAFDPAADERQWQPRTFELTPGTCVLVLPEDADNADRKTASQPWMVRINRIWFLGCSSTQRPQTAASEDAYVRQWELEQLKKGRLCDTHFNLEISYFYRLSDLKGEKALGRDAQGTQNTNTFCRALQAMGIVETLQAAAELISRETSGVSTAARLLNRFVVFSTHQTRHQSPQEGCDDEDDDLFPEDAADNIPLECVMNPLQVIYLGAKQGLPYMHAPVPAAAAQGNDPHKLQMMRTEKRSLVLDAQQQQHMELPAGCFCSLIFIKQTKQLFTLEEWADGTVGHRLTDRWVQASRQQARRLLDQSKVQLQELQGNMHQRLRARNRSSAAAASGGRGADSVLRPAAATDGTVLPSQARCAGVGASLRIAVGTSSSDDSSEDDDCQPIATAFVPQQQATGQLSLEKGKRKTQRKSKRPQRADQQMVMQLTRENHQGGSTEHSSVTSSDDQSGAEGHSSEEDLEVHAPAYKRVKALAQGSSAHDSKRPRGSTGKEVFGSINCRGQEGAGAVYGQRAAKPSEGQLEGQKTKSQPQQSGPSGMRSSKWNILQKRKRK